MSEFDEPIYFTAVLPQPDEETIEHAGRPHEGYIPHSGRYKWGSGENAYQRSGGFGKRCDDLKKEGLSEKEIADYFHITTTELRAKISADYAAEQKGRHNAVYRIYDSGTTSATEIAKKLGLPRSTVVGIINKRNKQQFDIQTNTVNALKDAVDKYGYVDVGKGVNRYMGITEDRLRKATKQMQLEGYTLEQMQQPQLATGKYTQVRILAAPGATRRELMDHQTDWHVPFEYSMDGGLTFKAREPVVNIDGKRVMIRYNEDGGAEYEGTMMLRKGVPDLSLGNSHYAQVRIGVENEENPSQPLYLKGMALYGNDKDFPKGVDIIFNTNKKRGTKPADVFKPQTDDPENPFGSSLKDDEKMKYMNRYYEDADGKLKQSAINVVKEEGDVGNWKKAVATQVLAKQPKELAERQLDVERQKYYKDFDELMSLTNPVVKEKLLRSFADECDSAAVELKAAAFPRQRSAFILPFPEIKNDEIYAPHYNNGEEVILIRYPHGGIFEIPRLRVNNTVKSAKEMIGNAKDAVGINSYTAEQLSGADFDGDTVLVIPTRGLNFKTSKPLEGLQNFNNKSYKITDFEEGATMYNGHKVYKNKQGRPTLASNKSCGTRMGEITNLIMDMTLKGASDAELERAVKHSQVIIDAYKHGLDFYKSAQDFNIKELKMKYQYDPDTGKSGAGSLFTRTKSEYNVPLRRQYYDINPETGEKIWKTAPDSERFYHKKKGKDPETGKTIYEEKVSEKMTKTTKGAELNPYDLVSKEQTGVELVYAKYATDMKALGDRARLESTRTGNLPRNPSAKKVYAEEIKSLDNKLRIAEQNAPLERQANLLAQKKLQMKKNDNPDLYNDKDQIKKLKNKLIAEARATVGAGKQAIEITDKEWEAIQSGAISKQKLTDIMANTDEDKLKERCLPRNKKEIASSTLTKIQSMNSAGYTLSEIAEKLGLSIDTVSENI